MAKKSGASRKNQTKKKERTKAYKPKEKGLPALVGREVFMRDEMIKERAVVTAFSLGHATYIHWEQLLWMTNMLNVAGQLKESELIKQSALFMNEVCADIFARHKRTGKYGITGPQKQQLIDLVNTYDQFWHRQTSLFYNRCLSEVKAFYREKQEQVAA